MNTATSVTITPILVADLLAEGERMPVYVHVIDHPDARVLVDTGMTELHPAVADLDPRLRPLSEQNFDLASIDIVVNTHLHFEHCGGNHLFADRPIYVRRRELDDARSEDDHSIREWVEAPGVRYVPVDGELELLPRLRLVPAPGHTRGMQVVVVETAGRPVAVGGDVAVWFGELDEPHTEGQLRVRALDPERVWLAHEHDPWRPPHRLALHFLSSRRQRYAGAPLTAPAYTRQQTAVFGAGVTMPGRGRLFPRMRILYGVVGEGMGHAMRSGVVLDHLTRNHEVQVVVSGRAHEYLDKRTRDRLSVQKIWGLNIVYEDNEVQNFRTVLANLKSAVTGMPKNVKAYFDIAEKFAPDVVISDFESWSYLFGKNHFIPVVSVDNIQMLTRCTHSPGILAGHETEFRMAKSVIKPKVAGAFHYLITTFFYPPIRKPRTTLGPPILRPQILAAHRGQGDHLLVYQTSTSNTALPEILARSGRECRIYGLRRDLKEDVVEGNLRYRPFSEDGFIDDLRTARGVIASGGFTLMGEAVYLHRPMLAIPIGGQFEQALNARYLEAEGYGLGANELTSERLSEFLERLPDFERRLAGYHQHGNVELLAKLDDILVQAVASRQKSDPSDA